MTPSNVLSVPEMACHSQSPMEDGDLSVLLVSYAIRQPGDSLWSAVAAVDDPGAFNAVCTSDAVYRDPQEAVYAVRAGVLAKVRRELMLMQVPDGSLRLLKGGRR